MLVMMNYTKMLKFIMMMKFSPSPININYFWNFGSLLILVLFFQIISGIFISFHYSSEMDKAFLSTIHISREVNYGWIIRMIHINGASSFFLLMFIHISKNLINSSWKFKMVWMTGIIIILMSMMVAFVGYVLPWGQMSFWAATVISNLLSIIPMIGKMIVEWVWGAFSVSYPTLNRFFSLHFLFPMIILGLIFIHIMFLHISGSSNSISSPLNSDKISFDPFFSIKDLFGVFFFIFMFMSIMLINPYYSVDSENFIEANPMITPIHIKPEWYFLFAYAILRAVPNKIGGVICLIFSIVILFIKPFQNKNKKMKFTLTKKMNLMMFFWIFFMLTFLGSKNVDYPYESMSKFFSMLYFFSMILI